MDNYLQWLGGLFDDEGSVSIAYTKNGNKYRRIFKLMSTLSQKDRGPLDELEDLFGGQIVPKDNGCYQWVIQSKAAANFLRIILPYVVLKRRIVEIALLYRALVETGATKLVPASRRKAAATICMQLRNEVMRLNALT